MIVNLMKKTELLFPQSLHSENKGTCLYRFEFNQR